MITKVSEKNENGAIMRTYETPLRKLYKERWKAEREYGWDSKECEKVRNEIHKTRQITVGDVKEFLGKLPDDLPFMHSHFEEGIIPVTSIDVRIQIANASKWDDEPENYVVMY